MSLAPTSPDTSPEAIDKLTGAIERLTAQLAKPRPRRLSRREEAIRFYRSEPETLQ
jgi:hypothetical protein